MIFDKKLLDIVACPVCKGALTYEKQAQQLICKFDKLVYPINDGIPVLLENQAQAWMPKETNS
ncbi:Trm112 family protein [uncultured Shewanella sp.]|uniref:Trm112 family protein n=1 Tax=uncultured Shewanella sp. TaxID=173975 RepID=UPI00262BA0BA|nr:Trm112 family protein [uncultured Shewanella sp.]